MADATASRERRSDGATVRSPLLRDAMLIAWKKECYRSSATARTLGASLHLIWPEPARGPGGLGLVRRYLRSGWETLRLIRQRRPRTVIVLNLPPFLLATVWLCRLFNRHRIVLDFHSGALTDRRWRRYQPLYRWTVRRAPFTATHNRFDGRWIEKAGGRPIYFIVLPRDFPGIELRDAPAEHKFLVVCSFAPDEPIDMLLDAFRRTPELHFEMTGNYRKRGLHPDDLPPNVTLTGFIDYNDYVDRMASSTAVVTLSDRSHIMQMAVHEAISLGVPVVTNHSPTLEEVLEDGGVFTTIVPSALATAFRSAADCAGALRAAARTLKTKREIALGAELLRLRGLLPEDMTGHAD